MVKRTESLDLKQLSEKEVEMIAQKMLKRNFSDLSNILYTDVREKKRGRKKIQEVRERGRNRVVGVKVENSDEAGIFCHCIKNS